MRRFTSIWTLKQLDNLPKDYTFSTEELIYKKLGKLEDIADLCEKITKLPICKKCLDVIYCQFYIGLNITYNFLTNCIEVYDLTYRRDVLHVDKYGIDWAFTREELEND